MRIVPSCGGFAVHHGDKPGETLVGWYSSNTKAHAALRALKAGQDDPFRHLFLLLAHIQCIYVIDHVDETRRGAQRIL